ncbi:hypothetical protein GCM10010349_10880 [Streptomyces flavofungini]|nr:hypothetical protein GCM10010349_10880 [Streptomyces flavofungini]
MGGARLCGLWWGAALRAPGYESYEGYGHGAVLRRWARRGLQQLVGREQLAVRTA